MLIDMSIVTLVSILYYLLCSWSRIINLVAGMLLIFIFCWAVGVNITFETEISEIEFLVIVAIINVWITIHSHHLAPNHSISRMSRFHHHKHNDHIYTARNRLNNFRLKSINDRFKASPKVYVKTMTQQINQLDKYVRDHSDYPQVKQLISSLQTLQSKIDNINYHLDLPMQINFPHGLKRLVNQYHQIINKYHQTQVVIQQDQAVKNVFASTGTYSYLHVNLRFPYQRLIHDRITHQVDLLVVNPRGIFAFTLLNPTTKQLNINQADEVSVRDIVTKPSRDFRSFVNLKNKLKINYEAIDYLIPNKYNVMPRVGIICTDPSTKIHLDDPKFKVIYPQDLPKLLANVKPVLTPVQVKEIAEEFRDCVAKNRKYEWQVFNTTAKKTLNNLIWYQDQVNKLNRKLT